MAELKINIPKEEVDEAVKKAVDTIRSEISAGGGYQCFHCCCNSVCWDADFDFSDFGYEGEGIVHMCHCSNCGAEIEYRIRIGDEEDDD